MKQIYTTMLSVIMLLVLTTANTWAQTTHEVGNATDLNIAIEANKTMGGTHIITLTSDITLTDNLTAFDSNTPSFDLTIKSEEGKHYQIDGQGMYTLFAILNYNDANINKLTLQDVILTNGYYFQDDYLEKPAAIYAANLEELTLTNVIVSNNTTGAIYVEGCNNAIFDNVLVVNNGGDYAECEAAGITIEGSICTMKNVTVAYNKSSYSGGMIINSSNLTMEDCIVWGNSGEYVADNIFNGGYSIGITNCYIGPSKDQPSEDEWTSPDAFTTDPELDSTTFEPTADGTDGIGYGQRKDDASNIINEDGKIVVKGEVLINELNQIIEDNYDMTTSVYFETGASLTGGTELILWSPNTILYNLPDGISFIENDDNFAGIKANGTEPVVLTNDLNGWYPFHAPEDFNVNIAYEREFTLTCNKENNGWQSIALPFNVTRITAMQGDQEIELVPLSVWNGTTDADSKRPFWLYKVEHDNGYAPASQIEANVPYLIAIPNDVNSFSNFFNVSGTITFHGNKVEATVVENYVLEEAINAELTPNFNSLVSGSIYALDDSGYRWQSGVMVSIFYVYGEMMGVSSITGIDWAMPPVKAEINSDSATGLENTLNGTIQIYPNPATDKIYIQTPDGTIPQVRLFNLQGTLLQQTNSPEINLANYANGIYLIQINGKTTRIIKQ